MIKSAHDKQARKISLVPPTEASRVGIIEIGSKCVRSSAFDTDKAGVKPLIPSSNVLSPGEAVGKEVEIVRKKLIEVGLCVRGYHDQLRKENCEVIKIYGTDVLRELESEYPELVEEFLPDVRILDGNSEALCSLISAVKVFPQELGSDGREVLIVDQGSGSLELAQARCTEYEIEITDLASLRLGTIVLMEMLHEKGGKITTSGFIQFIVELTEILRNSILEAKASSDALVVISGSPSTKGVWLREKLRLKILDVNYNKRLVHGQHIRTSEIKEWIDYLRKSTIEYEMATRKFVSPENPTGPALEEVVTGLTALLKTLQLVGAKEEVVSAQGSILGMAWAVITGVEL